MHTFISYNVAGSSSLSGLNQLLHIYKPLVIFLQEVYLSTEQTLAVVGRGYSGSSNLDVTDFNKPGNAVIWRDFLNVIVDNIVPLRLQVVNIQQFGTFVNVYGPTGSQGERERRSLFTQDLLPLLISPNYELLTAKDSEYYINSFQQKNQCSAKSTKYNQFQGYPSDKLVRVLLWYLT